MTDALVMELSTSRTIMPGSTYTCGAFSLYNRVLVVRVTVGASFTATQGLTLVQFSACRERFLRHMLSNFSGNNGTGGAQERTRDSLRPRSA